MRRPEPYPFQRPGCPGPGQPTQLSLVIICPFISIGAQSRREKYRHGTDVKVIRVCRQATADALCCGLAFIVRPRIRRASARPRPGAERTAARGYALAR